MLSSLVEALEIADARARERLLGTYNSLLQTVVTRMIDDKLITAPAWYGPGLTT